MAENHLKAIRKVQKKGPYYLGGHSLGGWIVFEIARQLVDQGEKIAFLGIIDIMAPNLADLACNNVSPMRSEKDVHINEIASAIGELYGKPLKLPIESVHDFTYEQLVEVLKNEMENTGILAPHTDIAQVRGILDVIIANQKVVYLPKQFYPNQITLFRAKENNHLKELEINNCDQDPTWGWQKYSAIPVDIHLIPGDHYSIIAEPHVNYLAKQINNCLGS